MLSLHAKEKIPFSNDRRLKVNLNFPRTWGAVWIKIRNENGMSPWIGYPRWRTKNKEGCLAFFCHLSILLWALRPDCFPLQSTIPLAAFCTFAAFLLPILEVKTMKTSQQCNWWRNGKFTQLAWVGKVHCPELKVDWSDQITGTGVV